PSPQAIERRVLEPLNLLPGLLGGEMHQLEEHSLRQGETLTATAHNQRGNNREREGNLQPQRRAFAWTAVDLHLAADLLDVGAYHVHADAAAGDIRNCLRRRKAGKKDQLQQLALVHLRGSLRGDQLALDGLIADALKTDAAAVVADLDDDVAALLVSAQAEQALGVFAGGLAHIGHLDAVIDRVADGVRDRVFDGFEQTFVKLGFLSFELQAHLFLELLRQVAHQARKFGED